MLLVIQKSHFVKKCDKLVTEEKESVNQGGCRMGHGVRNPMPRNGYLAYS